MVQAREFVAHQAAMAFLFSMGVCIASAAVAKDARYTGADLAQVRMMIQPLRNDRRGWQTRQTKGSKAWPLGLDHLLPQMREFRSAQAVRRASNDMDVKDAAG